MNDSNSVHLDGNERRKRDMRKIIGWLLGVDAFSDDQGGCPNRWEFPCDFTKSEIRAKEFLERESADDYSVPYRYRSAYIAPIYDNHCIGNRIYRDGER